MPINLLLALTVLALTTAQSPPQERTLTGCLRSGSASTVFILRGAAQPGSAPASPAGDRLPEDYLLVAVPEQLNLGDHLNHRIAVTGLVSEPNAPPPPPAAANAAEKALKKLSVKDVKEIAANCASQAASASGVRLADGAMTYWRAR